MKAKSWKKFVTQQNQVVDSDSKAIENSNQQNELEEDPLDIVLKQNPTLSTLMREREELQLKMAALTGQQGGDNPKNTQFYGAPIPSISQKKEEERRRLLQREIELDLIKKRKESTKVHEPNSAFHTNLSEPATNLKTEDKNQTNLITTFISKRKSTDSTNLSQSEPVFEEPKKLKKKKKPPIEEQISTAKHQLNDKLLVFDKVKKKKVDEWIIKDEQKREKFRKTSSDLKKIGSELQNKAKAIKQLNELTKDERFKDVFSDDLKNKLSKVDVISDKINKPFDAIKSNKKIEKLKDSWEHVKSKRLDVSRVKDKYNQASDKLMNINVGSFGAMQLRLDKNKSKVIEEKKEQKRQEHKEEEKREVRRKEREEERRKEKDEEQKAELKREEERESKRNERKTKKKEMY